MNPRAEQDQALVIQAVSEVCSSPELEDRTLIYLCLAGSRAYGRARLNSDVDLRGIYLPAVSSLLLQKKESALEPGEADCVLQPLAKFFELAKAGNPNVLEWLFVRKEHIYVCSEAGRLLLDHRRLFLSRRMLRSYLGFACGSWKQLQKMLADYRAQPDPSSLYKMVKHASHIERLLVQLLEALQTGDFSTWNPRRTPPFKTKQDSSGKPVLVLRSSWMRRLKHLHKEIQLAVETTELPEWPDDNQLDRLQMQLTAAYLQEAFCRDPQLQAMLHSERD